MTKSEKRALLYVTAVHEAGHAVARWYLDRTNYLGYCMPPTQHVAVSLNGEPLRPGRFVLRNDVSGLYAGEPCILPFISLVRKLEDGLSKRQLKALARSVRLLACADIIIVMAGPIAEHIHLSSLADAKEWDQPYEDATAWRKIVLLPPKAVRKARIVGRSSRGSRCSAVDGDFT
jgi:hypothetical protein